MPKQVIEPEIIENGQVVNQKEKPENKRAKIKFYQTNSGGCLALILFAFVSFFMLIPMLIIGLFKKKK